MNTAGEVGGDCGWKDGWMQAAGLCPLEIVSLVSMAGEKVVTHAPRGEEKR